MKSFVGVKFFTKNKDGYDWAIVPAIWLVNDQKQCYWPPCGNIQEQVKRCTVPNFQTWHSWDIKEICVTSGEFIRVF